MHSPFDFLRAYPNAKPHMIEGGAHGSSKKRLPLRLEDLPGVKNQNQCGYGLSNPVPATIPGDTEGLAPGRRIPGFRAAATVRPAGLI